MGSLYGPQVHRNNPLILCIKNVPKDFDEDDLKTIFTDCVSVVLFRGPKGTIFKKPPGIEDDLRQLFNIYPSFQRQSIIVMTTQRTGCVEGYVQSVDEREMMVAINDMNGKSNLIGTGKLRLSHYKQVQSTKKSKKEHQDFVINLSGLPPDVDEEVLIEDLHQIHLSDYIVDVYVARKSLSEISSTDLGEDNQINRVKLESLFHHQKHFRSPPDISINPPTNDGRVFCWILFNDPRDVTTAMEMYQASDDPDLFQFGLFKLRLKPLLDHSIELNSALTRAVPNKIKQTIDKIKNDPEFSNLRLIQKSATKNKQDILRITIMGSDIQQIYKARVIFDQLMKGKIFKFNNPSGVCYDSILWKKESFFFFF